jgi:hypothetical protein
MSEAARILSSGCAALNWSSPQDYDIIVMSRRVKESADAREQEVVVKAQTLPEVIRAFDPMHPLVGQELKDW